MVKDGDQEVFVELKGIGELDSHLPDTVNELEEDGSPLVITVVSVSMTQSLLAGRKKLVKSLMLHNKFVGL